ncbi:hypothetical protein NUU61_005487 [Penicillium alfredii]|uniref:Zn(2)-C6 fungal-type domain-containing protein n=1 Tax=Penicillium alfredii TaxID=1506179 RepID=A0A9W9F9N3_9EURO|nr:uncharacterized protein NUU61_005487 [Penicillium alfredii]KAJ5096131.1 hypothetical protein NUU61_005487 [Penicillium alfredii]
MDPDCRIRHKKCDEARPACHQCTRIGRKCDGYADTPDKRTRAWRVNIHSKAPSNTLISLVDVSQADLTPHERWYLDFFRNCTARQFASVFTNAFWGQLVHQVGEAQPAVRHAVISIGAIHWHCPVLKFAADATSFPLRQCNKALVHLQHNLVTDLSSRTRMETVLVSCLILVLLCFIQRDVRAVSCHLAAGFKLLDEWQKAQMNYSPLGPVLLQAFTQVHLHWAAATESNPASVPTAQFVAYHFPMMDIVEAAEEAGGFMVILGWLLLQTDSNSQPFGGTKMESASVMTLKKMHAWRSRIIRALTLRGESSPHTNPNVLFLDIWSEVIFIKIITDAHLEEGETRYDAYLPHFQRTIHLARQILIPAAHSPVPGFWARTGIISPLFFCALKCRDWNTRREALFLLSLWEHRPGIWSVSGTALAAARLIKHESEDLTPKDVVPETARIESLRVDFLPQECQVRLRYRHSPGLGAKWMGKDGWRSELMSY